MARPQGIQRALRVFRPHPTGRDRSHAPVGLLRKPHREGGQLFGWDGMDQRASRVVDPPGSSGSSSDGVNGSPRPACRRARGRAHPRTRRAPGCPRRSSVRSRACGERRRPGARRGPACAGVAPRSPRCRTGPRLRLPGSAAAVARRPPARRGIRRRSSVPDTVEVLLDVDAVGDRKEQHDHDHERRLELGLDRHPLLDPLHVFAVL